MRIKLVKTEKKSINGKLKYEFTWEYAPEDFDEYLQLENDLQKCIDKLAKELDKEL